MEPFAMLIVVRVSSIVVHAIRQIVGITHMTTP
jgi:hypothetical protein